MKTKIPWKAIHKVSVKNSITIVNFDSFDVFPGDKSEIYHVMILFFLNHAENIFLFLYQ